MDKKLFKEIYNNYYPAVYRICCGYVGGNNALVSDICQDVFINIWNAYDGFNNNCQLSTWIYRITVNCCLNELRKAKSRKKHEVEYEPPIGESVEKQQRDQDILLQCISKLCEGERIIMLLVLEGLNNEAIAKIIGTSNVNLRVKICRIKEKLHQIYIDNFSDKY